MKRVSKEPTLQQQLREMCNCNIDTSPCGAELECRACFNAADMLDECEQNISKYLRSIDSFNGQGISKEMIDAHNAARHAIDDTIAKLRSQERG